MSDLYQGCEACRDLAVESTFSFDQTVIVDALKRIYEKDFNPMTDIEENLFRETWKTFNKAVDTGIGLSAYDPEAEFINNLKTNNAVFSAFRAHRMQNDIAAKLLGEDGKLKPFHQFAKDTQAITDHHVNDWLRTEYDTAVIRAHHAADWKQYEDEKDVLPNLEWMPSTSIVPGEDHRIFWGSIYPVNSPFWNSHKPGDRWNCKCQLQATDKATNTAPKGYKDLKWAPANGLDNNPAKDGMLFSKSHPFYTQSYPGAKKAVDNLISEIEVNESKFKSGGVLQIPKKFNQGKQEQLKNIKAYTELAKNYGEKYRLLNLSTISGVKNPDAINLKTGAKSDAKIPITHNTKNAIQYSIKEAGKQFVSEVFIYLNNEAKMLDVWRGMKAALQPGRSKSIKTIIIRFKNGNVKRYETEKLRNIFNKKKGTL